MILIDKSSMINILPLKLFNISIVIVILEYDKLYEINTIYSFTQKLNFMYNL